MQHIHILGIKVTSATMEEIHHAITGIIAANRQGFVLSANIHGLSLARKHPWLADFYNAADIVEVDGAGVVLGARLLGYKIHKRLTWADWGWLMAAYFNEKKHSLFLLGGPEKAAEKAAENLAIHAPGLNVKGFHHGFFNKQGPENEAVITLINSTAPDIVWVGMGMPLQEKWILDNYQRIDARVFMPCGAAFAYLAGWTPRCPKWMGDRGLEWLYRFYQEPRKKADRYIFENLSFIARVIWARISSAKTVRP